MMKSRLILSIALMFAMAGLAAAADAAKQAGAPAQLGTPDPAKQASFEYVFKDAVKLDPAKVLEVREGKGKRFWYDTNNDGKIDECWFIDNDPRHQSKNRPILVRAIDEDGDMKKGDEPDRDSDLYVADWRADGVVDVVLDYEDRDKDDDLDSMGIYNGSRTGVHIWWSRDDGDDNLLWHDTDYNYYQNFDQVGTHFGGDESFYALAIKPGETQWTANYENPFLFWDFDGDDASEEVVRVQDYGKIYSLRWSFDADNDSTRQSPRDYDVSISAYGPGYTLQGGNNSALTLAFPDEISKPETMRGMKTGRFMDRDKAREWLATVTWANGILTWDENDNNVALEPAYQAAAGERWEGVINHAYTDPRSGEKIMPNVGGPTAGPFNKRYEYIEKPAGPFEYYYNPADKRVHLKLTKVEQGPNKPIVKDTGWINVDYDFDGKSDMVYTFFDTDTNGYFDGVQISGADGEDLDHWDISEKDITPVAWKFEAINKVVAPVIREEPARLYNLNVAAEAALEKLQAGSGKDAVWSLIEAKFACPTTTATLQKKLLASDESMMYYLRLAADRRIAALKKAAQKQNGFGEKIDEIRATGDTDAMTKLIGKQFKVNGPKVSYAKWIAELRKPEERKRVAWDDTWLPPNVGWESDTEAAYRMYSGHWDCFGKSREVLCYPILTQPRKPGSGSYHHEQDWGMDMLHIGNTCGLGGMSLWINGQRHPVYKPEDQTTGPLFTWHKGPIRETNNELTMECVVTNVGPEDNPYTVTFRPMSIGGRPDSPIEVEITGGKKGDKVEVGIGLGGRRFANEKFLIDEKTGTMVMTGFQDPEIGWVGLGVAFPASRFIRVEHVPPFEHYALLNYKVGEKFTYSIRGDWVRGHRFPVAPSIEDWLDRMRETAKVAAY